MEHKKPRILCVGRDQRLLECRCAVLEYNGYEARPAVFPEAYEQLHVGKFDLVIISARHAAEQNGAFSSNLPPETETLVLQALTLPTELLATVSQMLHSRPQQLTFPVVRESDQ